MLRVHFILMKETSYIYLFQILFDQNSLSKPFLFIWSSESQVYFHVKHSFIHLWFPLWSSNGIDDIYKRQNWMCVWMKCIDCSLAWQIKQITVCVWPISNSILVFSDEKKTVSKQNIVWIDYNLRIELHLLKRWQSKVKTIQLKMPQHHNQYQTEL